MHLEQFNTPATTRDINESGNRSNVSTFVKKEEKTYVRRYAMTEGRRRLWLENFRPDDGYAIMFPSSRMLNREEAESDTRRREKAKVLIVCIVIALVLLLLYPLVRFTLSRLVIEDVVIEGSGLYSAEELLAAGGLDIGGRLPVFAASTAESEILSGMPYVRSCNISVKLPSTVIIGIEEETAAVCTEIAGEYYALSDELKVLERSDSKDDFSSLLYIELPFTERAIVGEHLSFKSGEDGDYIVSFLELLEASRLNGRIGTAWFDEKFDLVASVDEKYRVLLGSPSDMKMKIDAVAEIIEENSEKCVTNGLIDVRIVNIAGITLNIDIDPNCRE